MGGVGAVCILISRKSATVNCESHGRCMYWSGTSELLHGHVDVQMNCINSLVLRCYTTLVRWHLQTFSSTTSALHAPQPQKPIHKPSPPTPSADSSPPPPTPQPSPPSS